MSCLYVILVTVYMLLLSFCYDISCLLLRVTINFDPCRCKTYKFDIMQFSCFTVFQFFGFGVLSFSRLSLFPIWGPRGLPFRPWALVLTPSEGSFWIPWGAFGKGSSGGKHVFSKSLRQECSLRLLWLYFLNY